MIDIANAQDVAQRAKKWPVLRLLGIKDFSDLLAFVDDQAFWDSWRDKLVPLVEEVFGVVFRAGADAGLTIEPATKELLPLDPEAINNAFDRIVTTYTDEWWRQFIPSTQRQMRDAIRRAQAQGTGVEGVISDLENIFGTQRAMTIAATETTRLFGLGAQAAYSAAGLDQWEWQTVEDFAVCEICRGRNKSRQPIAVPFSPAHPRCRCFPRPVVAESTTAPPQARRRRPRAGETDVQEQEQEPDGVAMYPKEGFTTRADIERWMHQKFPNVRFHFEGVDLISANHAAREIDRLGSAWPQVMARLKFFGSDASTPALWARWADVMKSKTHSNSYAFATQDGEVIMLNSKWWGDHEKYVAINARGRESGWSPKVRADLEPETETITHEFGHQIDHFMLGQTATVGGYVRASGLGFVGTTQNAIRNQHEKAGRKISRYGTTNEAEMWAESFVAGQYGTPAAKANPYVKAQTRFLEYFHPSRWTTESVRDMTFTGDIKDDALRQRVNKELLALADELGLEGY